MTYPDTDRLVAILGELNRAEQRANLNGGEFADWRTLADALPEYDADLSSHLVDGDPAFVLDDGTVIGWDDNEGAWLVLGEMPSRTIRTISRLDLNTHVFGEAANRAALAPIVDDVDRLEYLRPADRG